MLLAIYLNDHLAGATLGRELSRRTAGQNRDTGYGPVLAELAQEIEEDRKSLLEIMRALDVGIDRLKVLAAWSGEKLSRAKLNGQLVGYSPLSRLSELELLQLGVRGKLALWRSLQRMQPREARLDAAELSRLVARAEDQLDRLEEQRLLAADEAL